LQAYIAQSALNIFGIVQGNAFTQKIQSNGPVHSTGVDICIMKLSGQFFGKGTLPAGRMPVDGYNNFHILIFLSPLKKYTHNVVNNSLCTGLAKVNFFVQYVWRRPFNSTTFAVYLLLPKIIDA
jgi:hypothetical protein